MTGRFHIFRKNNEKEGYQPWNLIALNHSGQVGSTINLKKIKTHDVSLTPVYGPSRTQSILHGETMKRKDCFGSLPILGAASLYLPDVSSMKTFLAPLEVTPPDWFFTISSRIPVLSNGAPLELYLQSYINYLCRILN